ncbi:MAG: glycerol-3-phosphate acyltransferase [Caldisericaceae bacterium]
MRFFILLSVTFFAGSIPFSYLVGKILFNLDIRDFGNDNNPGPANSFRANGLKLGVPSLVLDYLKGVMPLYLIITRNELHFFPFVVISIAPILGHIFTPFLKFKGGKGITTTFGVWSALTLWEVPTFLGGTFVIFALLKRIYGKKINDRMIVVISSALLVFFVAIRFADIRFTTIAILNAILLIFGQYRGTL